MNNKTVRVCAARIVDATKESPVDETGYVRVPVSFCKALKEALEISHDDDGWQPIETAPRNGQSHNAEYDIDLWDFGHRRRLTDCFWRDGFKAWFSRSGGRAFNMGGDECFSHWRHKAEAPTTDLKV